MMRMRLFVEEILADIAPLADCWPIVAIAVQVAGLPIGLAVADGLKDMH